jgi:hypothetical protein
MENPFTKHCRAIGESYTQHLAFAVGCGTKMVLGGLACIVHGLLPFGFARTGSQTVFALYERLNSGARRSVTQASAASHNTNRWCDS